MKCCCVYCKQEFPVKGIVTHVNRTHLGYTNYSSGHNGRYAELSERANRIQIKKQTKYYLNPKKCFECDSVLDFAKRDNKYCNHVCAATSSNKARTQAGWTHSEESKIKISESLTGKTFVKEIEFVALCKCGAQFTYSSKNIKQHCSRSCAVKYSEKRIQRNLESRAKRSALKNYRADSAFRFNLKDFSEEFDFTLIEQHGWYKAKNRGNNLYGVSRDHMVTVKYGFENNIPAEHISHPANCKLMLHNKNVSKGSKNSIEYEDLLNRIKDWNEKYNSPPPVQNL